MGESVHFFLANKLNSKGNEVILITFLPIRCFEFHANFWKFRSQNGCAFPTGGKGKLLSFCTHISI